MKKKTRSFSLEEWGVDESIGEEEETKGELSDLRSRRIRGMSFNQIYVAQMGAKPKGASDSERLFIASTSQYSSRQTAEARTGPLSYQPRTGENMSDAHNLITEITATTVRCARTGPQTAGTMKSRVLLQ